MTRRHLQREVSLTLSALALLLLFAGTARGEEREVLFARGTALWKTRSGKRPVKLVELGTPASSVGRIQVAPDGSSALLDAGGQPVWVDLEKRNAVRPDCSGPALLYRDGKCLLCWNQDGAAVLYRMAPKQVHKVLATVKSTRLGFLDRPTHLVLVDGRGVWKISITRPERRQLLAPHAPEQLLVSPSGERAVATYAEKGREVLYSFKLDGKGARRQLMLAAEPVAWSRDSRWLLVQAGNRACVVRAVGGQYKCWNRFRAMSIDSAVTRILLSRDKKLYHAPLDGPRAARPKLLQERAPTGAYLP